MGTRKKVQAFVRVKPTDDFAHEMIKYGEDNKSIDIHLKKDTRRGVVNNQQTDWSFKLDGVLHDASQDLVYETVAKDAVSQALDGYNGGIPDAFLVATFTSSFWTAPCALSTIMCYGQTGAGKTYTMTGATENYKHRGILPRALQQVFRMIEERSTHAITVRVSYLEIYNENLFDLLSTLPYVGPSVTPMTIVENPQGIFIKGLSVHLTSQEEDAFSLLFEGETNRIIASHTMNKNSSRSHCIFTIYMEAHSRTLSDEKYITSKINLVDLAGSERLSKTGSEGRVLKEATYINKSLSFLEQAIIALGDQNRDHIPFRQSKLTHALKDSLGGNCNMILVTNIYGEAAQLDETLSSLRFASRMKLVTTEPAINEKYDAERMVKNLEKELALLKQELAIHDSLSNRTLVNYDPMDEIQIAEINSQVRRYLEGTLDEIDRVPMETERGYYPLELELKTVVNFLMWIINLRQIQEVFNQFRVVLSQQEQEVESALRRKYTLIDKNDFAAISAVQKSPGGWIIRRPIWKVDIDFLEFRDSSTKDSMKLLEAAKSWCAGLMDVEGHLVGEPDGQSFGLGVAPFSVKPGKKPKTKKTLKDQYSSSARKEGASSPVSGKDFDVASLSKTQLIPSSKDGDLKDVLARERETSSIEPLPSDSPREESRAPRPSTPPSKPVAFEEFKNERGSEINRIFKENKSILNERKKRASETTQRINAIKQEIDVTKDALNFQKSLREKQGRCEGKMPRAVQGLRVTMLGEYENKGLMIIDEEEFLLILKLKDLKKQYRNEYQELRDLRAEIQYCQRLVDQCRHRLLMEFDIWYNESFVIPEDVQVALKLGSSIRPGMVPLNRIVCLGPRWPSQSNLEGHWQSWVLQMLWVHLEAQQGTVLILSIGLARVYPDNARLRYYAGLGLSQGEDDQDRYSQLQQTVLPEGPDSMSFYNARVKTEQKAYGKPDQQHGIRRAWWRAACIINVLKQKRPGVDQGFDKPFRP
ncbi:Kinesin-like protein KIF9 [Apodemus speciosus]|uniref:Kinesin-like protein n=1 Tax=Apodemus speciosus TaxID=105296 RepID=A0ABQ0F639_APOSI